MIVSEEMINEVDSYLLAIENAKQVVQVRVDEMEQFYKEVCDELNDEYEYLIGKKVRIYTNLFDDVQRIYEGWFYGFEVIRENYCGQYTPAKPHVKLFKCKKDGSASKIKQDVYEPVTKIVKIEEI
jgi:adenine-specific DNA methylase